MSDDPQVDPVGGEGSASDPHGRPSAGGGIPTSTVVVGALLLLVVGLGVGYFAGHSNRGEGFGRSMAERHFGDRTGMPQGGFGMGASGGTALGSTAVAGTVTAVDGDTVTIQTLRGETVTIRISSATQIRVSQAGSLGDLTAGSSIVVIGQPDGAGGLTAVRVIEGAMSPEG